MRDDVRPAVRRALCACLGLASDSPAALALLREAWTEPENAPRPARTADVIYWSLTPEEGDPPASLENGDSGAPLVRQVLLCRLLLVCFGPSSADLARRIRALLFLDGRDFPREILRRAGVFPVPQPPPPEILHEPEGSLWRQRADLTVTLQVADSVPAPFRRGTVRSAPLVFHS